MNALVRKELRQILLAQIFLAALFAFAGWSLLDPDDVLAPYHENEALLHATFACFCLAEGLVLGLGQFAAERWQGTEAYLVHRGTGREGAFAAKACAAIVSLILLAVIPPAAFGAIHLTQHPYAGSASIDRLVQLAAAGCTAFAGYGLGALVAQVERSWAWKAMLAIAGSTSLLLVLLVGVLPTGPDAAPSMLRHLTLQLVAAVVLLWSARHGFVQGSHPRRTQPRAIAWARSALATALFASPFLLIPLVCASSVISKIREREPEIVADEAGALYIATPTDRDREEIGKTVPAVYRYGTVYDIADQDGRPVDPQLAVTYVGSFRSERPFQGVFASHMLGTPKLGQEDPLEAWRGVAQAFVFGSRWIERDLASLTWCFNRDTGKHWVRRRETDLARFPMVEEPRWRQLDVQTPHTEVVRGISSLGDSAVILLPHDGTPPLTINNGGDGREPDLVAMPLPDGDRVVGRDLLIQASLARVGMRGHGRRDLVRGERDRYVWKDGRWVAWSAADGLDRMDLLPADDAPDAQRYAVDVDPVDGLAYHVTVRNLAPGGAHLGLAVDSATFLERRLAETAALLSPPVVALASWWRSSGEPRRAWTFAVGIDQLELLQGRQRTWIMLTVLGLAAVLVRDLARRLERGGAPIELRILWCGATALLGFPVYVLCRLIEPRAARSPRRAESRERRTPRFEIRTA